MSLPRSSRAAFFIAVIVLCGAGEGRAADLLSQVASFLGISATPSQMKAPDATNDGDIWIVDAGGGARTQVTTDGGYSWPVFDPGAARILALKAGELLEIPLAGGRTRRLVSSAGISKLIGFDRERPDRVLILRAQTNAEIAVLSLATGEVSTVGYDPQSSADRIFLAHLRGEERAYGNTTLYVRKEGRSDVTGAVLEWTDVFIKEGDKRPRNLSQCDGVNCSQPSLSADRRRVAFVRVATN
jgi:hypothetical protein